MDLRIIPANPAVGVHVPKPPKHVIRPLTVDQVKVFLVIAGAHRLAALFLLVLATGLRLGEACGIRWDDLDLATGQLRIRQQLQRVGKRLVLQALKTEKSRRTLIVPAIVLAALRRHRTQQLEERLKAGGRWVETGLVFTTYRTCTEGKGLHMQVGAGLDPRNVLRVLHALLADAKLPRQRFHDLRHACASVLLAQGVQLAEITLLLGHSELRVTADLYSHLQQETAAKAAQHMDRILQGGS